MAKKTKAAVEGSVRKCAKVISRKSLELNNEVLMSLGN